MTANNNKPLAVITGGSSGIGFELARQFIKDYNVLLCADGREKLTQAADRLRLENDQSNVEICVADLTTREGVEALYDAAKALGPVEALAANAGMGVYGDFVTDTDLDTEMRIIDLNTKSVVHITKLIAKDMVARGKGKILITASLVSFMPDPYQIVYAATKAFDYMFAQGLREKLEGTGVTVTALMPGATDTNFFFTAGATNTKAYQDGPLADPADVAEVAYKALQNGDDHVVHGFMNKVMAQIASIAPPNIASSISKMMMAPKKKAS